MRRWNVVTPETAYTEIIVDGQGPTEWYSEVIEVEAETARDAIKLGVVLMLKDEFCQYCKEQRLNDGSPYTGVRAEEVIP